MLRLPEILHVLHLHVLARVMTEIDCGATISGVSVLVAEVLRPAT
jgi:hypothetical protein